VAIQVSDLGGHLHLSIQRDDATTPVDLDSLEEPIALITKALKDAAILWDFSQGLLEQAAFGDTLYALAANGSCWRSTCARNAATASTTGSASSSSRPPTSSCRSNTFTTAPAQHRRGPCPNLLAALEHGSCCHPGAGSNACAPCPQRDDKAQSARSASGASAG
jgi:hypothetical protein